MAQTATYCRNPSMVTMSLEVASKLKPGDRIEVKQGRKWVLAEVVEIHISTYLSDRWYSVTVRRVGTTKAGRRYPSWRYWDSDVRAVPDHDPVTGNVFADYLDDHGHHEAAALLRRAFPYQPAP